MTGTRALPLRHEGATLKGQLALPEGPGPHPALLVMHNAMGLGRHMVAVAERLAAAGYVGLATDMYGDGQHFADAAAAGGAMGPLLADPALLRARAVAWFDALGALPEVDPARRGALGYCFGGLCVLELARSGADARIVVSYHGLLGSHARAAPGTIRAHVAVHTGSEDPWAPRADVDALRAELSAGGSRWQISEYGGVQHAFTDPDHPAVRPGIAYDRLADAVSWADTLALLTTVM